MTIPHHYSMKWDNYHSHVGDIFSQLLETGSMADVILYAEGEKINCHKMLLSACSPYFQEILSTAGASNTIVVVSGICGEDVRSIIEFVYRGEISVKADRFSSVLKAAEALKICGLMEVSSHLAEMEESETIISNQNLEKENKSYKEMNCGNLVTIKENNRKSENNVTTENSKWDCIQVPVHNYNILETNKTECNSTTNNENVKIANADCSLNVKTNEPIDIDVTPDIQIVDDQSNENSYKVNLKQSLTDEISVKQDTGMSEEESSCEEFKLKRRKEYRKKMYSEEAMTAALEDMKSGKNLVKAAAKHRVPRTTLYMRARAIGACAAMVRKGYPREKITAALKSVAGGSSLQCAATEFGIPKTVLWRRVQKEIGNTTHNKRVKQIVTSQVNPKETVLQEGVSITRVSPQYQIPKATLFRWEKVHLTNEAKLSTTFVKDPTSKQDIGNEVRLEPGVVATTNLPDREFSHGSKTEKFKIQKSALWGNIQNSSDSGQNNQQHRIFLKSENEDSVAVEQLKQQQPDFHFSEGVHELPVSYVNNTQFSDSSIIILAPVESDKYTIQQQDQEQHSDEVHISNTISTEEVLRSVKVEKNSTDTGKSKENK